MNLLVTGGAGFIGSNLVNHLLGPDGAGYGIEIEKIVTLDKLTYAGSPDNLAAVEADPRHLLVRGDICDSGLVGRASDRRPFAIRPPSARIREAV